MVKYNPPKPLLPVVLSTKNDSLSPKIKEIHKCKNCLKHFDPKLKENCYYHPGKPINYGLRVQNCYDEIVYDCCNAKQIGFNPILKEAKGCTTKQYHEDLFLSN